MSRKRIERVKTPDELANEKKAHLELVKAIQKNHGQTMRKVRRMQDTILFNDRGA